MSHLFERLRDLGIRWRRGKTGSVFRQLVVSYIVFAVVSVFLLNLCMIGVLIFIGGGQLEALAPYELVDDEGNVDNFSSFERLGGWIEQLDASYQVTKVYGEKKDLIMAYTMEELTEYLMTDNLVETKNSASEYRGYLKAVCAKDKTTYYLIKIARDALKMSYTYNVGKDTKTTQVMVGAFLSFGLLFLMSCVLMSAYLSRKIRKPLQKIMSGMEQVRAGDSQVRLEFEAQREFAEIRDTFNMMIGQLDAQKRRKQEDEERKNRMLLEISHDIKTPVSTIKSSALALEDGLIKSEELPRYYQMIDQKAGRVNMLVNELFQLLKMEDKGYRLQMERTDLCELVRQICAEHYEEITGRNLDFQIQIPETPIYAELDRKEFARVIENLLGNAGKYNQTGRKVAVELQQEEGKARLSVWDDGEQIAEELRPVLFDPFVRGDSARRSSGGTGLGLAIASKIVEKHGGELRYVWRGEGNEFLIILSAGKADNIML